MRSKSWLSIIAMAKSIIIRNLSRRTSADSGDVCVIAIGTKVSTKLPVSTACRVLLLRIGGLVVVFGASDGDFMVVSGRNGEGCIEVWVAIVLVI
jgi:hypothetical protein